MVVAVVTGSSGRVGAVIAATLDRAGWTVRGVDRAPGPWTAVVGDLRQQAVRHAALRGAHAVVHSAALHAPHVGVVGDGEFRSTNVDATRALLAEAEVAGVRRFVYISSTSVYGDALVPTDRAVWVDERLTPLPRDIYDETKLAAERLVGRGRIPAVVLRIARCFPEPLGTLAIHRLHRGVDVADVAEAVVLAVARPAVSGTFNISGPHPFLPEDCPALLHRADGVIRRRAPQVAAILAARGWPLPRRLDRVYDSRAAAGALGYRPARTALHLLTADPTGTGPGTGAVVHQMAP